MSNSIHHLGGPGGFEAIYGTEPSREVVKDLVGFNQNGSVSGYGRGKLHDQPVTDTRIFLVQKLETPVSEHRVQIQVGVDPELIGSGEVREMQVPNLGVVVPDAGEAVYPAKVILMT